MPMKPSDELQCSTLSNLAWLFSFPVAFTAEFAILLELFPKPEKDFTTSAYVDFCWVLSRLAPVFDSFKLI
jgi:hypothetical protein